MLVVVDGLRYSSTRRASHFHLYSHRPSSPFLGGIGASHKLYLHRIASATFGEGGPRVLDRPRRPFSTNQPLRRTCKLQVAKGKGGKKTTWSLLNIGRWLAGVSACTQLFLAFVGMDSKYSSSYGTQPPGPSALTLSQARRSNQRSERLLPSTTQPRTYGVPLNSCVSCHPVPRLCSLTSCWHGRTRPSLRPCPWLPGCLDGWICVPFPLNSEERQKVS